MNQLPPPPLPPSLSCWVVTQKHCLADDMWVEAVRLPVRPSMSLGGCDWDPCGEEKKQVGVTLLFT